MKVFPPHGNVVVVLTLLDTPDFLTTVNALVAGAPGVLVVKGQNVLTSSTTLAPLATAALGVTLHFVGLSVVTSATTEVLATLPVLETALLASCHNNSLLQVSVVTLTRVVNHYAPSTLRIDVIYHKCQGEESNLQLPYASS